MNLDETYFQLQCDRSRIQLEQLHAEIEGRAISDFDDLVAVEDELRGLAPKCDPAGWRHLSKSFGLSQQEMRFLWTMAAIQVSPEVASVAERFAAHGCTLVQVLGRVSFGVSGIKNSLATLSHSGVLFRSGLLVTSDGANGVNARSNVTVAERALEVLVGGASEQGACAPQIDTESLVVGEGHMETVRNALSIQRAAVVVVRGPLGVGKRSLFRGAATQSSFGLAEFDAATLSADPGPQLREFACGCRLRKLVPLLRNLRREHVEALSDLESLFDAMVFVTTAENLAIRWDRPVIEIEMEPPTTAQRKELWQRSLESGDEDAELLAERYPLAPALIVRASEAAKGRANGRKMKQEDVLAGIRAVLDDKLGQFGKRVNVTQTWEDLVLPQDQLDPIVELLARVRGRRKVYEQWGFAAKVGKGLGVSALFSGPPGTGKTMIAALIAKELGLELYQIDLGKLVSKFIGETEKQLGAMFDAAEAGHAILLFDEADSLFGKRTDVKSSNDRYANLETNYLLQRLETFTGICLLTSNHESNIDPAFYRRLSLHVRFDLPDEAERAKLWRAVLPKAAPVEQGVDFGALARRYEMSGGYIKNAALRAAFLAADEDSEITGAHLERAARVEYEAMGKLAA